LRARATIIFLRKRLAHRWLHWRVDNGADGAISRLTICRSTQVHRACPIASEWSSAVAAGSGLPVDFFRGR
jgi:hypothetical protein